MTLCPFMILYALVYHYFIMKNDNLRLSSSECIRAQIQREEIEKIIIAQRRRAEAKSVDLMSQMSFTRRS